MDGKSHYEGTLALPEEVSFEPRSEGERRTSRQRKHPGQGSAMDTGKARTWTETWVGLGQGQDEGHGVH